VDATVTNKEHEALGQEFADIYRGLSVQLADL
jgi:hypothetical protein